MKPDELIYETMKATTSSPAGTHDAPVVLLDDQESSKEEDTTTMCGEIYFSEPDRDIRITWLAKYLQDIDMEAMTYLWSKAANG